MKTCEGHEGYEEDRHLDWLHSLHRLHALHGSAFVAGRRASEGCCPSPDRRAGEGLGPFKTLAIRGVMVIDGTGAPPAGPMDVIVEGNRIARIVSAGTPGLPLRPKRPPQADHEIDAHGHVPAARLHQSARAPRRRAEGARRRIHVSSCGWRTAITTVRGVELATQALALREKDAQRGERHRRAAHLQLSAARRWRGPTARSTRRRRRARGCAGARRTASTA